MNTKWKKITPKELATKCNNIFNASLKSENIKYRVLKDLYLTELSFHFNNQDYYARAEKCSDDENTSYTQEYKNSSQQRKVTLNNWEKNDIKHYFTSIRNLLFMYGNIHLREPKKFHHRFCKSYTSK